MEALNSNVVTVLKNELVYKCSIWSFMDQVVLEISDADFEKHMGRLIQQIQIVIEKHFPERKENLCIIIRNKEKLMDNVIKIWKSF